MYKKSYNPLGIPSFGEYLAGESEITEEISDDIILTSLDVKSIDQDGSMYIITTNSKMRVNTGKKVIVNLEDRDYYRVFSCIYSSGNQLYLDEYVEE